MKEFSASSRMTRRRFLAATGAAIAVPTFIPASVLGKNGAVAPSNRITLGVVGMGVQGPANTQEFLRLADCQVVAACDLDKNHLEKALHLVSSHYKNEDCAAFHDYRELM